MIAVIGSDGTRPVVWGLGETAEAARIDADKHDLAWDSGGSATCEVSREIAARVVAGEVGCESLGILVHCYRNGQIADAELGVTCECGAWSGEVCSWHGPVSVTVIVEWMPPQHRDSHRAAGNRGVYPHNGALRLRVHRSCAELNGSDGPEWFRILATKVQL